MDKSEIKYLKDSYNLEYDPNHPIFYFWERHPNTARLFEDYNHLLDCIPYLHSLRNTIPIYDFAYDLPFQYNEYLLKELNNLNEDHEIINLCKFILDPERTIEELYIINQ